MSTNYTNQNPNSRRSEGALQPDSTSILRPVYAAFSNMARMNLYITLKYIGEKFGVGDNTKEGEMYNMGVANFTNQGNVEVREGIRAELLKRVPVLQSMTQACINNTHKFVTDGDIVQILQLVLHVVCDLRNFYTHVGNSNLREQEQELLKPLDVAFDAAKRQVKERFSYNERDYKFIDGDECISRVDGKYVYHTDYYFRLRNEDSTGLSSVGVAFLLCKFLHRKYAYQFLVQSQIIRNSPFRKCENEIMAKIFCAENIHLPQARLVSILDAQALGLDMLNELQKCPTELYDTLSPRDQKVFNVVEQEAYSLIDEDINLMRRHGDRFPFLAMRYIDETNVLPNMAFQVALGKYRYKFYNRPSLDSQDSNRVRIIQKEINGFGSLRKIEEKRKAQYTSYIRQYEDVAVDTALSKPYLTDHQANYAITSNRIGLTWNDECLQPLNDGCFLPALPIPQQNADGSWSVDKKGIGRNEIPRCWLSTFDLPALIFLKHLGGTPDEIIKQTYRNLLRLFDDIAQGNRDAYIKSDLPTSEEQLEQEMLVRKQRLEEDLFNEYQLHANQIPEKIADFLMGLSGNSQNENDKADKAFKAWAKKYIDDTVANLNHRLERLENDKKKVGRRDNRVGKKSFVDIRPGSLARYLAQDILAMQPIDDTKDHQGKITSMDFNVMQAALATYHDARDINCIYTSLGAVFIKAGLVEKHSFVNNPHPFLHEVLQNEIHDTVEFYQLYLKEKINYLTGLTEDDYSKAPCLRGGLKKHPTKDQEYIKTLASRYRATLQLPDGLFTDAIQQKLKELNNPTLNSAIDSKDGNNVSYLLSLYFKEVLQDDSQPFYRDYKRHYNVLDTLKSPTRKNPQACYLTCKEISNMSKKGQASQSEAQRCIPIVASQCRTQEEQLAKQSSLKHQLNRCQENERHIRRHKTQDMLLFLMAKQLLLDIVADISQFKLQNIIPIGCARQTENNLLNQPVRISQPIKLHDESMKPLNNPIVEKTIVQERIKLKNYGDFYLLIYDTRIGILLSQLEDDTFRREDIEKELDSYDRIRKQVFCIIHSIERASNTSSSHNNFRQLMDSFSNVSDDDREKIIEIRNAFCHNRYPHNLSGILDKKPNLEVGVANQLYYRLKELSKPILNVTSKN